MESKLSKSRWKTGFLILKPPQIGGFFHEVCKIFEEKPRALFQANLTATGRNLAFFVGRCVSGSFVSVHLGEEGKEPEGPRPFFMR